MILVTINGREYELIVSGSILTVRTIDGPLSYEGEYAFEARKAGNYFPVEAREE